MVLLIFSENFSSPKILMIPLEIILGVSFIILIISIFVIGFRYLNYYKKKSFPEDESIWKGFKEVWKQK
jgi:hypothetical protein